MNPAGKAGLVRGGGPALLLAPLLLVQSALGCASLSDLTGGHGDGGSTDSGSADAAQDMQASEGDADAGELDAAAEAAPSTCEPPEGGPACDPGFVPCGFDQCSVPQQYCCATTAGSTCEQTGTSTCEGGVVAQCDEAADCPPSRICCLLVTGVQPTTGTVSCQAGPCSGGILAAQICRSNTECAGGACIRQVCTGGTGTLQACTLLPTCTAI